MLNLLQKWFSGRTFPVDVFKRPSVLMGVGAALSLLIVAIMWRSQATYVPLYGTHQKVSVDEVSGVLAGEHIDFRINPDNGQLLVDSRQLPRARMVLAGKNIQPLMAPGLELMDKDEVLGASQYIQNIRYQRGLEGELARSITTISGIEEARVHLGIRRKVVLCSLINPQQCLGGTEPQPGKDADPLTSPSDHPIGGRQCARFIRQ